jgi:hypothetical protein
MTKGQRVIVFILSIGILCGIMFYWKGIIFPSDVPGIILFTALIMLSFVILFLEHYFTQPTDVLSSTIAILLLLSPLRKDLKQLGVWFDVFYFYNLLLAILSICAIVLLSKDQSETTLSNRISGIFKLIAVKFCNGRVLFVALFFLALIFYVDSNSGFFFLCFCMLE